MSSGTRQARPRARRGADVPGAKTLTRSSTGGGNGGGGNENKNKNRTNKNHTKNKKNSHGRHRHHHHHHDDAQQDLVDAKKLQGLALRQESELRSSLFQQLRRFKTQQYSDWDVAVASSALDKLDALSRARSSHVLRRGGGTLDEWTECAKAFFTGRRQHNCAVSAVARDGAWSCTRCQLLLQLPPASAAAGEDGDTSNNVEERAKHACAVDRTSKYYFVGTNVPRAWWACEGAAGRRAAVNPGFAVFSSTLAGASRPVEAIVLVKDFALLPKKHIRSLRKKNHRKRHAKLATLGKNDPARTIFSPKHLREFNSLQFTYRDARSVRSGGLPAFLSQKGKNAGHLAATPTCQRAGAELEMVLTARFKSLSSRPYSVRGPHIYAASLTSQSSLRSSLVAEPRIFKLKAERGKKFGGAGFYGQLLDAHMQACATAAQKAVHVSVRGSDGATATASTSATAAPYFGSATDDHIEGKTSETVESCDGHGDPEQDGDEHESRDLIGGSDANTSESGDSGSDSEEGSAELQDEGSDDCSDCSDKRESEENVGNEVAGEPDGETPQVSVGLNAQIGWAPARKTLTFVESVYGYVKGSPDLRWNNHHVEVKSVDSLDAIDRSKLASYKLQTAVYQLDGRANAGGAIANEISACTPTPAARALLVLVERGTGDFTIVEVEPANAVDALRQWKQWLEPYSALDGLVRSFRGLPQLSTQSLEALVRKVNKAWEHRATEEQVTGTNRPDAWTTLQAAICTFLTAASQARLQLTDKAAASARAMHGFSAGGASKPENNVWTRISATANTGRANTEGAGGYSTTKPKYALPASVDAGSTRQRSQHSLVGMVPVQVMMRMSTTSSLASQAQKQSRDGRAGVPLCKFGRACSRPDCHFQHPTRVQTAVVQSPSQPGQKSVMPLCRFGRSCSRPDCHFQHPAGASSAARKIPAATPGESRASTSHNAQHHGNDHRSQMRYSRPCRYGDKCRRAGCTFEHPQSVRTPGSQKTEEGPPNTQ